MANIGKSGIGESSSSSQKNSGFPFYDTAIDQNFHRPPAQDSTTSSLHEASFANGKDEPALPENESVLAVTSQGFSGSSLRSLDSAAEKETYVLSATGDVLVKLIYENTEIRYLVVGHILRIISPVWEKCLDPNSPFKSETVTYDDGQHMTALHLEEDDPDCLLNLFRCTHFQYGDIPTELDFHQLRALATICDKYDCAKVLKPWLNGWLAPWEKFALKPGYEDWLFISTVFGHTNKVNELISLLQDVSSSLSICGSYLKREGRNLSIEMIPERMLDQIIEKRDRTVKTLTEGVRNTIELLLNPGEISNWCTNEVCISLAHGSLLRSIKKSGLWALFSSNRTWHGSVKDLRAKLSSLTYITMNDYAVSSLFTSTTQHYDPYSGHRSHTVQTTCNHSCKLATDKNGIINKLKGINV